MNRDPKPVPFPCSVCHGPTNNAKAICTKCLNRLRDDRLFRLEFVKTFNGNGTKESKG